MNLIHLEYFIILAETLNYTKASEKLHITQPNLSKVIINIEQEIDCKLFKRNKRDVQLTSAGKIFYKEIKITLESYRNVVEHTQQVHEGISGVINIGLLGTAVIKQLPNIINTFNKKYPKIAVKLTDYTYSPLVNALYEEEIDIAILPDQELHAIPNICKKHIFSDDMCLVVHKDHKYAKFDTISIHELKTEPFIHMSSKKSLRDFNLINDICLKMDFLPNTVYEANTLLNMLMMVECKIGVTILASHMSTSPLKTSNLFNYKSIKNILKSPVPGVIIQTPALLNFWKS